MPIKSVEVKLLTRRVKPIVAGMCLLLSAAANAELHSLAVEGYELHSSLTTRPLADNPMRHVPRDVLYENPQYAADPEFVRAIAASGSQGKLDAQGIRAALFALYAGEHDLGIYGLEAESVADADRLEAALRKIWAHNASIHRARVHRRSLDLVVVWTDGVSTETWEAVNAGVAERLTDAGSRSNR